MRVITPLSLTLMEGVGGIENWEVSIRYGSVGRGSLEGATTIIRPILPASWGGI